MPRKSHPLDPPNQSRGGGAAATLRIAANRGLWTDYSLSVRGRRGVSRITLVAIYQALTLALTMHISNKGLKQIYVMTYCQLALEWITRRKTS